MIDALLSTPSAKAATHPEKPWSHQNLAQPNTVPRYTTGWFGLQSGPVEGRPKYPLYFMLLTVNSQFVICVY